MFEEVVAEYREKVCHVIIATTETEGQALSPDQARRSLQRLQ